MSSPVKRRRGPGRPPLLGQYMPVAEGRVKFTTRLRPSTIEFLRELGRGYANVGIERTEKVMRGFMERAVKKGGKRGNQA